MDWKRMAIAGLKREREKVVAGIQAELQRIDTALAALGGAAEESAPRRRRTRKPKQATPEQKAKRAGAMQAAHDAMAVKRGKATPEQIERHNKRLADKAQANPHARAQARMSPGASLREAAAS